MDRRVWQAIVHGVTKIGHDLARKPSPPPGRPWMLFQFSSIQLLSHVWLFVTPWTAACQASLSITNSQSLLTLISIESMMSSSHLVFYHPLLLLNLSQHQGLFQWVVSHYRWPKYWSINKNTSSEYSGLISFRIDWFYLLAVKGTLKSLLQHCSLKVSILQCSAFFMVQLSHPYMTTGKTMMSPSRRDLMLMKNTKRETIE